MAETDRIDASTVTCLPACPNTCSIVPSATHEDVHIPSASLWTNRVNLCHVRVIREFNQTVNCSHTALLAAACTCADTGSLLVSQLQDGVQQVVFDTPQQVFSPRQAGANICSYLCTYEPFTSLHTDRNFLGSLCTPSLIRKDKKDLNTVHAVKLRKPTVLLDAQNLSVKLKPDSW